MKRRPADELLVDADSGRTPVMREPKSRINVSPVGRNFDVVKVPSPLGRLVIEAGIGGPVINEPAGLVYFFLVPVGTSNAWPVAAEGMQCLGDTSYIPVPVREVLAPPGPHWLQWPIDPDRRVDRDRLVDPDRLAELLCTVDA
ncbi:hypothetical protein [Streptomyces sp. NPDC051561]|uniref:hypothetical protein n=1 Tax=Streptomyces sp. NPDC051561 TaxID=3365658 RepID=UPI003795D0CA